MPRAGDLALSTLAGGAAGIMGGLRIAGGLSLIRRGGRRDRRGRPPAPLRPCLPHCRNRLPAQHSAHVAALLLLSIAGIVIYMALALVSHLVLRRWHESALG